VIYTTYIANLRNIPPNFGRIRVARPSILGPSDKLLTEYKAGIIDWDMYELQYRFELLANPEVARELETIKRAGEVKDLVLFCYEKEGHCHRHILASILKEMGAKIGGEYVGQAKALDNEATQGRMPGLP